MSIPSSPTSTANLQPNSPLSQVDPNSLDYIFNLPPDQLTDEQLEKTVAKLEADREKYMAHPEATAEPKKDGPKRVSLGKKIDAPTDLSTDDLLGKIGL